MTKDIENVTWPEWETVQLIGRGSFGAVYEIQRDVFGEPEKAALKVISIPQNGSDIEEMYSEGYDNESITSTFKSHLKSIIEEYTLMRKMSDCVNIVNCDDIRYVQHDDGIGWDIFIKMELLTPLTKAISTGFSKETVIKIAKDMCMALDMCKSHNVIHRDIKPQNIFVSPNGDYKLGDFGIAKTVEKTMGGTKIGTYKYMAPEVYHCEPYGSAADIYSLGLVLYWLMNERRMPFMPLPPEKIKVGIEEQARERRFSGEQIPAPKYGSSALKAIVLKACAYDPSRRYNSPSEMYNALDNIGKHSAPPPPPPPSTSKNLDIRAMAFLSEEEAASGCTKKVSFDAGKQLNVKFPAGTKNRMEFKLTGAGMQDATTGVKGNAYVTVMIVTDRKTAGASGMKKDNNYATSKNKAARSVVITTAEALRGGNKEFSFKDGIKKTVSIPAGCKNGQVVDGVCIYVHDFNFKITPTELSKMPNAVLEMYANHSSGFIGGTVLAFVIWMIFGMSTMQIPIMGCGLTIHFLLVLASSVNKRQKINEAKRLLEQRTIKNNQNK